MRIRYVILLQLLTIVLFTYICRNKIDDAYLEGVADGVAFAVKYPSQTDKVCSAWLFQTSLKEAKNRMCGGKKG